MRYARSFLIFLAIIPISTKCQLFQFPQSFHYDKDEHLYLDALLYLLAHSKLVQILFNNHAKNQATINAKMLEMLLQG